MTEFLREYWLYLTIVLGVVFLLSLGFMGYTWYSKRKADQNKQQHPTNKKQRDDEIKMSLKDLIKDELSAVDTSPAETVLLTDPESSQAESPHIPSLEETPPLSVAPATGTAFPDPVLMTPPSSPPASESPVKARKEKKELGRYHVLYRKEDNQWYVKREGTDRILRVLPTQREAIAFATIKAITQNTSFVIHRQDGKIRK